MCYGFFPMAQLPRGIAPELLISQVLNTMPYLLESAGELARFKPTITLRQYQRAPTGPLSHFEYFRLCLSSHYLTCGTPVPTDVDKQIRQKLWPRDLPLETALEMADLVLESRKWDFTLVTSRFIYGASGSAQENEVLNGVLGEWFTVAVGAYCAMKQYSSKAALEKGQILFSHISDEVNRHSEIFGSLMRAKDGLGCLKASTSLAHNLGDLDRVMDMWELSIGDPLRLQFYKLGSLPFDSERKLRYLGRLWISGELYKSKIAGSSLALENHRHFALRKPKCLRSSPDFCVPTAPFFDDWGRKVARGLATSGGTPSPETLEVIDALVQGWERQPGTLAYGRALRGILEVHPELGPRLEKLLARAPGTQVEFEGRWAAEALIHMDDIPSRAT